MPEPAVILMIAIVVGGLVFLFVTALKFVLAFSLERWTAWCLTPAGIVNRFLRYHEMSLASAVVRQLDAITRLNLPLIPALSAAADGERGRLRHVLLRMSRWCAQGMPLSQALLKSFPGCPRLVSSTLQAGEEAGQLSPVLRDLRKAMDDEMEASARYLEYGTRYWVIPFATLVTTMVIMMGVMTFIMPKYRAVFSDFDARLPAITEWIIQCSIYIFPATVGILALAVLGMIALWIAGWLMRRDDEYTVDVMFDALGWVPLFSRPISEARGMSMATRFLKTCLVAGVPPATASKLASSIRVNHFLRRRWLDFAARAGAGAGLARSAEEAGMGNMFVCGCRSLERSGGDVGDILNQTSEYYRALAVRWTQSLNRLIWPFVTLALGCMVGALALAFFTPLVVLIESCLGGV